MIADPALEQLRAVDPEHYLLHDDVAGEGWRPVADLACADAWPTIARAYAAEIGASSPVVGGSCALQGYAGRVAALSIGRWAVSGRGLRLAATPLWVRLRAGRTVGLALEAGHRPGVDGPETPTAIAADLVTHLAPVVVASRTISRLRPAVAWGNVAAAVAGAWRRVHDAAPPKSRPGVEAAAASCLDAEAWPWDGVPLTWEVASTPYGASLTYRRETCCLMRLAEGRDECGSCDRLTPAEVRRRWATSALVRQPPPRLAVTCHG